MQATLKSLVRAALAGARAYESPTGSCSARRVDGGPPGVRTPLRNSAVRMRLRSSASALRLVFPVVPADAGHGTLQIAYPVRRERQSTAKVLWRV